MQPRIIMKFGGTSVGNESAVARTCSHIAAAKGPALVVVSAMGGITDLLLYAASAAVNRRDFVTTLNRIEARHRAICEAFAVPLDQIHLLESELSEILQGIAMLQELSKRVKDRLLSMGERISARILAGALTTFGHRAVAYDAWDLGLHTDSQFGNGEPLPDVADSIAAAVAPLPPDITPVVTGFVGQAKDGSITTLGRGGSDFSAALFGAALKVDEIQIWTDVPGFLDADPSIVPNAKLIPTLHFDEAVELAYFGAKVLHPRTIEPARKAGIPVRILGAFDVDPQRPDGVDGMGTLIDGSAAEASIRALALRRNVHTLHVHSSRMLDAPGFLARLLGIFSRHNLSVDVVATSEVSVSMTFDCSTTALDKAVAEASEFARVEVSPNRSIICIVGEGLRTDPSLLARIFTTCAANNVPVHVISQGASRLNLTMVTDAKAAPIAMAALHNDLLLP
jgi:aspartate kinase